MNALDHLKALVKSGSRQTPFAACFYCGVYVSAKPHGPDCPYAAAQEFIEETERQAKACPAT